MKVHAFPQTCGYYEGMDLREYFASSAIVGLVHKPGYVPATVAQEALSLANAMLTARATQAASGQAFPMTESCFKGMSKLDFHAAAVLQTLAKESFESTDTVAEKAYATAQALCSLL